ncbi:MAG: hypothetical protein HRT65_00050 [Flavobacteriaceae bacterium]|uniref:hypothetical protein n=1 Tax=Flagellimonas algarum TaxID=3230298 RepID=UPI003398B022|nr:hypothetical protein [Flavobacteriaceae bacterium]
MATKKTKQTLVEKATFKALGLATKANDFALLKTEQAFDASLGFAQKSMGFTTMVVKKGLDISATQQDLVFDLLHGVKKRIVKN